MTSSQLWQRIFSAPHPPGVETGKAVATAFLSPPTRALSVLRNDPGPPNGSREPLGPVIER